LAKFLCVQNARIQSELNGLTNTSVTPLAINSGGDIFAGTEGGVFLHDPTDLSSLSSNVVVDIYGDTAVNYLGGYL